MFYYVYILKSKKSSKFYIGCTENLIKRLKKHNNKEIFSTKFQVPWELRYYEAFFSKADAFNREKKLKQNYRGWQELKKRLEESLK